MFKVKTFSLSRTKKFAENNETTVNKRSSNENINEFVDKFLQKHQKPEFREKLLEQFKIMYINSVSDLINLPAYSWENIQHSQHLGPVIIPLLKKEIEQKRTGKSKKKDDIKTKAESLADLHKVKRFILNETNVKSHGKPEIDKLGYLNLNALKNGFEEQKMDKKFDGGPVLEKIKTYLEDNFATPNQSILAKPSHGMILVNKDN